MTGSWSVGIFSAREDPATLAATVRAAVRAAASHPTSIEVIINGNPDLARTLAERARTEGLTRSLAGELRVWHLALADKAHALNEFIHAIFPAADLAFFVDGNVRVNPDAFVLLADHLAADPQPLGATGVPTCGRSARRLREQMLRRGGFHGNLGAIRGTTIADLRRCGFRLPLGLYRVDSVLGAVLAFALDPANNTWEPTRVLVCPDASWAVTPLSPWRLRDLRAQWQRIKRQAQGKLENLAVQEHLAVNRHSPESLPQTNAELIMGWVRAYPARARRLCLANPLLWLGVRNASRPRDWSGADIPPELIAVIPAAPSADAPAGA